MFENKTETAPAKQEAHEKGDQGADGPPALDGESFGENLQEHRDNALGSGEANQKMQEVYPSSEGLIPAEEEDSNDQVEGGEQPFTDSTEPTEAKDAREADESRSESTQVEASSEGLLPEEDDEGEEQRDEFSELSGSDELSGIRQEALDDGSAAEARAELDKDGGDKRKTGEEG